MITVIITSGLTTAVWFVLVASGLIIAAVYPIFVLSLDWLLPASAIPLARSILPTLLLSTWITSVATTVYSGLDANQRYDLRGYVLVANSVAQLAAAAILVPRAGLLGMTWALVIQWSATLGLAWILLRGQLAFTGVHRRFRVAALRELLRYGLRIQATWALTLWVDPITKSLLGWFGTLEMVAYYDMASRLVMQLRQLIISAIQVLTARMADLSESAPERIPSVYCRAFVLLAIASVLFYGMLAICLPVTSQVWIGRVQAEFVQFGVAIAAAAFINTLSCPAFFANIGTGCVSDNTIALTVHVASNLILGGLLGVYGGGAGVVIGSALAMMLGGVILIVSFARTHDIPFDRLLPGATRALVVMAAASLAVGYWLHHTYAAVAGEWAICVVSLVQFAAITVPLAWIHPVRRSIVGHSYAP